MIKVSVLNESDIQGGAARAAYRIHHALRREGVDSKMMVNKAVSGDWTVRGPKNFAQEVAVLLRKQVSTIPNLFFRSDNKTIHSSNLLMSGWSNRLNHSNFDLVHLHWLGKETISIADIGDLTKPLVWTLHDMWAFCGAEHYTEDRRWSDGYNRKNRPSYEKGFDVNRWVWKRKKNHWKYPIQIVTPSSWLAECVQKSKLMSDWPVSVIPNAIDTQIWKPVHQTTARELLQLPIDAPLILFGAEGGRRDYRKGFDLLQGALQHLSGNVPDLELLVFGQLSPKLPSKVGFPIHYTGHLHDDLTLRVLYSAADLIVIPSRQDNLPNTGVEALACGTPVVAFNTCGLQDIVHHKKTGYLAKAFDIEDLASGVCWVLDNVRNEKYRMNLDDSYKSKGLNACARRFALNNFSYSVVAKKYIEVYRKVLA